MTIKQLEKIKQFAKTFYTHTGKYHAWDHIELVLFWAKKLARKQKNVNLLALEAAVYLHDIGRSIRDEGHPKESGKLSLPFLKKMAVSEPEISIIIEAVEHHDKDDIKKAHSIEAKLLFDADKLQIVSFFGFMRCVFWLIDERKMDYNKAIDFLLTYIQEVNKHYLQTDYARKVAKQEYPKIKVFIKQLQQWQNSCL